MSVIQIERINSDPFKMSNNKDEINIWTNDSIHLQEANNQNILTSAKGLRKSYSASTISTASIKTSSDSNSSISTTSKQSTQTNNSNKSFPVNPALAKDARIRNFIVGSVNHQVNYFLISNLIGFNKF